MVFAIFTHQKTSSFWPKNINPGAAFISRSVVTSNKRDIFSTKAVEDLF